MSVQRYVALVRAFDNDAPKCRRTGAIDPDGRLRVSVDRVARRVRQDEIARVFRDLNPLEKWQALNAITPEDPYQLVEEASQVAAA